MAIPDAWVPSRALPRPAPTANYPPCIAPESGSCKLPAESYSVFTTRVSALRNYPQSFAAANYPQSFALESRGSKLPTVLCNRVLLSQVIPLGLGALHCHPGLLGPICCSGFIGLTPVSLSSSDKKFPAFGFGARIPPNYEVHFRKLGVGE